eukprot:1490377-Pyramimonas_sp.AAC.1
MHQEPSHLNSGSPREALDLDPRLTTRSLRRAPTFSPPSMLITYTWLARGTPLINALSVRGGTFGECKLKHACANCDA